MNLILPFLHQSLLFRVPLERRQVLDIFVLYLHAHNILFRGIQLKANRVIKPNCIQIIASSHRREQIELSDFKLIKLVLITLGL